MILGIGVDIVELERVKVIMERQPRFIDKCLTANEKGQWQLFRTNKRKVEFLAGRFAAKEAFSKALGTGIGRLGFQDIEITTNKLGAPSINSELTASNTVFLSLSHSDAYAVAQVVIEKSIQE